MLGIVKENKHVLGCLALLLALSILPNSSGTVDMAFVVVAIKTGYLLTVVGLYKSIVQERKIDSSLYYGAAFLGLGLLYSMTDGWSPMTRSLFAISALQIMALCLRRHVSDSSTPTQQG